MSDLQQTIKLTPYQQDSMQAEGVDVGSQSAANILYSVYLALQSKGYNPVSQLVGYVLTGDPTYITSHNGARSLICRLNRDEILEELVSYYLQGNFPADNGSR